jgi:hypothetical protein
MRKTRPTYRQTAPGEFVVRVPRDYNGPSVADDIEIVVLAALLDDVDPQPPHRPPGITSPGPVSPAARAREHERRRIATLQRVATSQRHLNALLENEGMPLGPRWTNDGQRERAQHQRRTRERSARYRPFEA